jgi:glycosyltransferase involved in cell wall biosynthesis
MAADLPVSVLLLARDERDDLAALLPSLAFAREVVVVWDERGDAAVRELAQASGARVFAKGWEGFGAQRRFALAQCTQPWVLWLDADERLDARAAAALAAAVSGPGDAPAGYALERATWFLGARIRFCGWQRERLVRLFRRDRAAFDDAPVHERLLLEGDVATLPGTLEHHSYPTLAAARTKMLRYAEAGAEKAYRAGRRAGPLDPLVRAPLRFLRQYVLQLGVLDGWRGVQVCAFAAGQVWRKYARLAELTRQGSAPR